MRVNLTGFKGENRALHPKVLSEEVGSVSRNQHPGRGDLRPWNAPGASLATVNAGAQSIYRMGRDVPSDTNYWLQWNNVVNAMRGFTSGDTTERTYYTGDGAPKVTDNTLALTAAPYPSATRLLGIPAPLAAPAVAVLTAGSSASTEDRYYVYTYVSDWGEEGPPSPVSIPVQGAPIDQTYTLSGFSVVPAGYTSINKIRVYRTASGTTGATNFFFVMELTAWGSADDTVAGTALAEGIATNSFFPPNADMTRLTPMWNGMAAGITGKAVRYCEPFTLYAWPPANETLPPDATPVALVVYAQNLLVLTTAKPLLVTGSSPDSFDEAPLDIIHACVSARSAVSVGHGAVWASPEGLAYFGAFGSKLLTDGLMTREDWQAINPTSLIGTHYKGLYFGFYQLAGVWQGFIIDPNNPTGMYFLDAGYKGCFYDDLQDALYLISGTDVVRWDAGAPLTVTFKSKTWKAPHPINMSCASVISDNYPVTFKLYGDGALRHTQTVQSRDPFWLPGGYLAEDWAIQLECTTNIQAAALAESIEELKAA